MSAQLNGKKILIITSNTGIERDELLKPLDALRAVLPYWFPRVNEIIRLIGSHNVLCTPTAAQFDDLGQGEHRAPGRLRAQFGHGRTAARRAVSSANRFSSQPCSSGPKKWKRTCLTR